MTPNVHTILLFLALVFFILGAANAPSSSWVSWGWLGAVFITLSMMVGQLGLH